MKTFCFTVDDNIRFIKELTYGNYDSIFDHPYIALYKRLHYEYGIKVQLNLFWEQGEFNLSMATDKFRNEFAENSDWLKLSFHSKRENVKPYESSGYYEVCKDCADVHCEILRFASPSALAKTTTLHYCLATNDGLQALKDNGVRGLLGLYGTKNQPRTSYQNTDEQCQKIREGEILDVDGIAYAAIDVVLNEFNTSEILSQLQKLSNRVMIKVMIHEQYFYMDYRKYQPDFEQKLAKTFDFLTKNGYQSTFLEYLI